MRPCISRCRPGDITQAAARYTPVRERIRLVRALAISQRAIECGVAWSNNTLRVLLPCEQGEGIPLHFSRGRVNLVPGVFSRSCDFHHRRRAPFLRSSLRSSCSCLEEWRHSRIRSACGYIVAGPTTASKQLRQCPPRRAGNSFWWRRDESLHSTSRRAILRGGHVVLWY